MAVATGWVEAERGFTGVVPPWQYYRGPAFYAMQRGAVYRMLGRSEPRSTDLAIEEITTGVAGLPEQMRTAEWVGDYLCQLVLAYRQVGDRAGAEDALRQVRAIATRCASTRLATWVADARTLGS